MQDIKINVSDLWKVHAKVKQYLRALEQIENASAAFLAALKRQDSVSYETLSAEWESGIIEHEEKIKERLESIADILGKYLNDTGDYVGPRVRILPMRVDSLDIGFNLAQIERNVKSLSKIVTDSGGSYPDYKHAYIDYLFYSPEQKAAMLAVENAERIRRENNYRAVESFRNAVKSRMAGCMQEALDEMQRIQSGCIEPLDRADTEYGLMLQGQYLIWEGVRGVYEEKERIAGDVKDALWDKLADIFNMTIALGSVSTEDLFFYRMGWAEESYETAYIQEMESFGGDLITDPENTLGAIGQSKIDSMQENGIAYAVTSIATDIALTILIDKGMKAVTGGSAKAEKVVLNQTDDALDDVWMAQEVLEQVEGGTTTNNIMDEVFDGTGSYSGKLEKVNSPDVNADMLAERIGGESRVKFTNDPKAREFDAISNEYIAQAKPALSTLNKNVREQMKATFEAAKQTGKKVYYQFEGTPAQSVIDKLYEYSERYGIEVIIDTNPLN